MIGSYCPAAPLRNPHEVVEPPRSGPVVERAGRPLDIVRREVPLAESAGYVAVLGQDPRQCSAAPRLRRRVSGKRAWELGDRPETHPVVVAPGQQRGPSRRAQRGDVETVVRQSDLLHARHVGVWTGPPKVSGCPNPASSIRQMSTFGAPSGAPGPGDDRPVGNRFVQRAADRPAEVAIRDREHGAVGAELAHRLGQ